MQKITKKSKIIILSVAIALVLSLSIILGSIYGVAEFRKNKYDAYINALPMQSGNVNFSDWNENDVFNIDDYNQIDAQGSAKILLFSDIHFGNLENMDGHLNIYIKQNEKVFKDLKEAVDKEKPNLIIFTGDIIASRDAANDMRKFADYVDSFNIPWTFTFGNHEGDGSIYKNSEILWLKADKARLAEILSEYKNCLYRNGYSVKYEDNLYSIGNDIIRVKIDGKHIYNVFTMDSNSYIPPEYNYDSIRKEQVAWYEWAAKNSNLPNMIFMHMPITQYYDAFQTIGKNLNGVQPTDNKLFEKMKLYRATDIYSGHLHGIDNDVSYEGINFHFAVTSSAKQLYGKRAGYKSIVINNDLTTKITNHKF